MEDHLTVEYLKKYAKGKVFIETGTFIGNTVQIALDYGGFDEIHSIEINKELYEKAVERFKDQPTVHIHLGDSVDVLPGIVDSLTGPATFWLDAHASGSLPGGNYAPCPLLFELNLLREKRFNFKVGTPITAENIAKDHVIFIDDRRLLGSQEWGGVTAEQVSQALYEINPAYKADYLDGHTPGDVIVVHLEDK